MGGGRAPCCDKNQVKRGPWSPAEDLRLITFIQKYGHENWRSLPKQAGLLRCGKSCRLRWINYLRPDVKRGNFTPEEEETIIKLHQSMGNKWSKIASQLPGRTDNEIKNVWNTHLKKRLISKVAKESSMTSPSSSSSSSSGSFKSYENQNIEMDLGDQASRGLEAKSRPREVSKMAILEEKQDFEAKEPSSSSNSYDSKTAQVDEELMGSLFDFSGPYDEEISDDGVFELPLESDSDFWNMLDNLGTSFQSNEVQLRGDVVEGGQRSNFEEAESRKWLRNLENELGLEATREENEDYVAEPPVLETLHHETMLNQEINPGMPYFQTWPSSPQNLVM